MNNDPAAVLLKRLKVTGIIVLVLILAWIGYEIYLSTKFHIVSTNPTTKNVATVTPFLKVNFNRQLSSSSVSVTSKPSVVSSYSVHGKQLTLLLTEPMTANKDYTITIHSITDTAGEQLVNKSISFTPQFISEASLPSDQQNALLKAQSNPSAKVPITYTGTDALVSNGLTAEQVQDYQQDIQSYATSSKIKLSTAEIDTSSVTTGPLNGSGVFSLVFNVSINNTPYKARAQYNNPDTVELLLFNAQTGAQVYDSGSSS